MREHLNLIKSTALTLRGIDRAGMEVYVDDMLEIIERLEAGERLAKRVEFVDPNRYISDLADALAEYWKVGQ